MFPDRVLTIEKQFPETVSYHRDPATRAVFTIREKPSLIDFRANGLHVICIGTKDLCSCILVLMCHHCTTLHYRRHCHCILGTFLDLSHILCTHPGSVFHFPPFHITEPFIPADIQNILPQPGHAILKRTV